MSVSVDITPVQQAVKQLGDKFSRVENKAVNEAAGVVANRLEMNTPVWEGVKSAGSKGDYMLEHAKDHIVQSKAKDGYAEVGFDKEVGWRIHFVEFGTINQRPNSFVEMTQEQVNDEVIEIIARNVKEALGL